MVLPGYGMLSASTVLPNHSEIFWLSESFPHFTPTRLCICSRLPRNASVPFCCSKKWDNTLSAASASQCVTGATSSQVFSQVILSASGDAENYYCTFSMRASIVSGLQVATSPFQYMLNNIISTETPAFCRVETRSVSTSKLLQYCICSEFRKPAWQKQLAMAIALALVHPESVQHSVSLLDILFQFPCTAALFAKEITDNTSWGCQLCLQPWAAVSQAYSATKTEAKWPKIH